MKKKDTKAIDRMYNLKKFSGTLKSKWMRNLRMFEWSPTISLQNMTDAEVVGYYQQGRFNDESDTTSSIQENVIRSCIETLLAKISSYKVRPFFNTVNGTFKDMQICKQAQQFFDILFQEQNMNSTLTDVFRDACIFDRGVLFVDRNDVKIKRVMPWQLYLDPREYSYGNITQIAWEQNDFPVRLLPVELKGFEAEVVTLWQYWDLNEHKHLYFIPEADYYEEETWEPETIPFLFIHYTNPVKSTSSSSVVDLLYGIQMEIDYLNTAIKNASQRGQILKYIVPNTGNIRTSMLTNRAGEVVTYTPIPNQTTPPIMTATDPFMDPQWLELMDKYKQDAYELVGISQLSASSQKPEGINSGIGLSTLENIEADRFETQLNTVIRSYVDTAKLIMEIFDGKQTVLPESKWRANVTWEDIVNSRNNFSVQFSAGDFLSNDPSVKIQQVQALQAMGQISQARAGLLLEIPDIQQGYSLVNNHLNAVLSIIDDVINEGITEIPDYVNTQILMEETLNTMLSLRAAGKQNSDDIAKLEAFYALCVQKQQGAQVQAEMAATAGLTEALNNQMAQAMTDGSLDNALNGQQIYSPQSNNNEEVNNGED